MPSSLARVWISSRRCELLQWFQGREPGVADAGVVQIQLAQIGEGGDLFEAGVGDFGAAEIEAFELGQFGESA